MSEQHILTPADTAGAPGDCFYAALMLARELAEAGAFDVEDAAVCAVVHGYVDGTKQLAGTRFTHAWVEIRRRGESFVCDFSNGGSLVCEADRYYRLGGITSTLCYSVNEAWYRATSTNQCGPWEALQP